MTLGNVRNLYQQVIVERYKKPRFRGVAEPVHRHHRGHNPSCGDTIEITVSLKLDDQNRIERACFEGEGCSIAMASADLMAEAVQGLTIPEALHLVEQFQGMVKGEGSFPPEQRKLNVMQGVAQYPVRIKCATLCWHTLKAALEASTPLGVSDFVSNEATD
ncbi:MAG: SUF system NifU family Fe-S cluster assembly protein [Gloeomargaritaceae cyanobacterium C42_A2020_066]|nr:SUF system NifU family Fe-S cluster assembly protein [Gloeomargaritaceae cyanobacterium C42_A2020_066]